MDYWKWVEKPNLALHAMGKEGIAQNALPKWPKGPQCLPSPFSIHCWTDHCAPG